MTTSSSKQNSEQWVPLFKADEKVVPRSVWGRFARLRWVMVWLTQLFFYGMPWVQYNGRQALLFDLDAKLFYVGPLVLYPQDFIYLTALLIICALSLFLFTAVLGRVWCGYTCPQTVYSEIFMWIEHKIEGDRAARLRLAKGPLSINRLSRLLTKHALWLVVAFVTGLTFVGYFVPVRTLTANLLALQITDWSLFWVVFYSAATYGNAGWLREQVCKYMCPYARFQSAMFDRDTLLVTYDEQRGEPRGPRGKNEDPNTLGLGSCIDCGLCVQVCPTGIDIRKGLQYECIGCAACADVCDTVMERMNYPKGLIRYSTQNALANGWGFQQILKRTLRPRVLVYTAILWSLIGVFLWAITNRPELRVDIVRDRTVQYRLVEGGKIENVYRVMLMNTTEATLSVQGRVSGRDASVAANFAEPIQLVLQPTESKWVVARVQANQDTLKPGSNPIALQFTSARMGSDDEQKLTQTEIEEPSVLIAPF